MSKIGFVMMTALLPTQGHLSLIDFAKGFMSFGVGEGTLHVMLCSRSFEPLDGNVRFESIKYDSADSVEDMNIKVVFHHLQDDTAPQNPEDTPDFWHWWRTTIIKSINEDHVDYVFASEPYGVRLAKELGGQFIPYDLNRRIDNVKSSDVRNHLNPYMSREMWMNIAPTIREHINMYWGTFVLFGQESVGKSTLLQRLKNNTHLNATYVDEWARPYLETVGAELTEEKMHNIFNGQMASQYDSIGKSPITIFDTDLLSTIGYMRLKGWDVPMYWGPMAKYMLRYSHYFVLSPDGVPFVEDPLRYGGDKRETTMEYWTDILDEFGCSYSIISGSNIDRVYDIEKEISDRVLNNMYYLIKFKRE